MSSIKFKKTSILTFVLTVVVLSFIAWEKFTFAQQGAEIKLYSNDKFHLSFEYPSDWHYREQHSIDSTPFSVVLSDIDINQFHAVPHKAYPDKFVSIAFRKTTETEHEYFSDYAISKLNNLEAHDPITTKSGQVQKHEGVRSRGQDTRDIKHFYVFDRSGEYLVEIATYIENSDDEELVENVYDHLLETLELDIK